MRSLVNTALIYNACFAPFRNYSEYSHQLGPELSFSKSLKYDIYKYVQMYVEHEIYIARVTFERCPFVAIFVAG